MNDPRQQNEAFVTRLISLCDDPGHRAALRRWWSEGTRYYALPVLGHLFALDNTPRTLLAALYAQHAGSSSPHAAGGNSVGRAALLLAGGSTSATGFESMERHFRRLLAADDFADLGKQLQRLAKRLAGEAIPLDYAALLSDLRQFGKDPGKVKTRWAMQFWQAPEPRITAP